MKLTINKQSHEASSEPEGWNPIEFNSFNNKISYTGLDVDTGENSSANGNGDPNLKGSYSFLNGPPGQGQGQAPASRQALENKSKKEQLFDNELENYKKNRNAGIPGPRQAM